ncbi:MAG: ABC transporter permease subunit [Treponema sp.]|nr:ABC transporter permease subunit [Treponema sp.]
MTQKSAVWLKKAARDFSQNRYKYIMIIPVLTYFALFAYKPMYGLIIAFEQYRPALGFYRSPFVGLRHFKAFFNDIYFFRLFRNTISISLLNIIFGFPAPILLALLLNEIKNVAFKRTIQTVTYMPYFISIVIVCALIRTFSSTTGIFSQIAVFFGGVTKNYLTHKEYFYPIYVISDIWQGIGWNSIIYLAALTSIDQEQYEAARIDGAGRLGRMIHITLPNLLPTIVVLFILRMGGILSVGFEKIILLYNEGIYERADVISTYVYRRGILEASYSYASAVGMFNSLVNVFFLVVSNKLSRKFTESSLF